jgi:allophanate hydrolase
VSTSNRSLPLNFSSLRRAYRSGEATPTDVVLSILEIISGDRTKGIWTCVGDTEQLISVARSLERSFPEGERPPLYGMPFAVKDNIDVGGMPTTVACPDFAYTPRESAPVVERLRAAGALCIGKTNLDQFATGLVGVRSPYGIPPNAFDARYVTGGSSSGSAAAVTRGHVAFALGTDTAGSGRIPAGFNHIVGLKPSSGLLSTRGVVPACRSLDCVSVMALTCEDARDVAAIATGFDSDDPFSRPEARDFCWTGGFAKRAMRAGVPRPEDRSLCDSRTRAGFEGACAQLEAMGVALEEVDLSPFFEAGRLLYGGPWIAERVAGLEPFIRSHPESLLPIIRTVLADAERHTAVDAFRALHRLAALRRTLEPLWKRVDALMVPTSPTLPTIEEVAADPVDVNTRLGGYATFVNLLQLAAIAVPGRRGADGLPTGVTFIGPWGRDVLLVALGSALHATSSDSLGATGWPMPERPPQEGRAREGQVLLAVVGAHLSGQPLNHQLTERGASFFRAAHTAPSYRLFALAKTQPAKPGLVRDDGGGTRIEVEVWSVPLEGFGPFVATVSSPLCIGQVELEDGTRVHGFLCESHATRDAKDISEFGGWRPYLARG